MPEKAETTADLSHDLERYAAIAAVVLLVIGCYLVVRPFVTAFLWAAYLRSQLTASTPGYLRRSDNDAVLRPR
jgi:hypothetical protein